MTTPRGRTMWELNAFHPDKTEPFDFFCRFYDSEEKARARGEELAAEGWEHINIVPPPHLRSARDGA